MSFNPGTYTVKAEGYQGPVAIKVEFSKEKIESIEIGPNNETKAISKPVFERLPKRIIAGQTLNVDPIKGAGGSSRAVLAGVAQAIDEAGGDAEEWKQRDKYEVKAVQDDWITETDVLIMGSGGAGLSAAIEAKEAGADVLIVEQMSIIGGNTNRATGGMNAAETQYQKAMGIEDSVELFYKDTMEGGHNLNDPDLVRSLVENSESGVEWVNTLGGDLTDVNISGGASVPRFHRSPDGKPVGPVVVETLLNKIQELNIPVLTDTAVTEILMEDDTVSGVKVENYGETYTISADAVVVASGGFGANADMLRKYAPELQGSQTTNQPGATGSGINAAQGIGAEVIQMEQIQVHPTTAPGTGALYTEGLRGDGAILINKDGRRFVNELETRDVVVQAELEQPDGIIYMIFTQELADNNASTRNYIQSGVAEKAETVEELAEKLEIDGAALKETIATYNEYYEKGEDEAFGRTSVDLNFKEGPFYAIPVTPSVHHTMGGLKIDTGTHVYDTEGRIIPGLYAAGEATGGVHGGNRIGGNAMADIVVHGRIAGQNAAKNLKQEVLVRGK